MCVCVCVCVCLYTIYSPSRGNGMCLCMVSEICHLGDYFLALGQDCRLAPDVGKPTDNFLVAIHKAIESVRQADVSAEF